MPMPIRDQHSRRRVEQRTSGNADRAEFAALTRSTTVVDAGALDERISGATDDYDPELPDGQVEDWQETDLITDSLVGEVQVEIERRMSMLEEAYPFELRGNNLRYIPSTTGYYEFCLAITQSPSITEGRFVELPRQFERTAAHLLREYMGWRSTVLHIGWPRDPKVGIRFRAAMETLNRMTGEWAWGPTDDLPVDPDPAIAKDEGVDFVVWKDALDRRVGHLFLLCQCACGNDWVDKLTELNLDRFCKWFHPACRVPPMRTFATPFVLSNGNMVDAQKQAGLVFDRVRLTLIAEKNATADRIVELPTTLVPLAAMVFNPD